MAIAGAGLLLVLLVIGAELFGLSLSILYHLAVGLVVGAVARLVLPGEEKIGLLGTALIGMAGGAGGHLVGRALHLGELLQLGVSIALAATLLTIVARPTASSRAR